MKSVLLRSNSGTLQAALLGSPRSVLSGQDSTTGISFPGRIGKPSPGSAFHHFEIKQERMRFRRALSESDLARSESWRSLSQSFSRIAEQEETSDLEKQSVEDVSLSSKYRELDLGIADRVSGIWQGSGVVNEELEFSGGGMGKGKIGGGKGGGSEAFTGGSADQSKMGAYYQEMLKADPGNPLLLRNYARFLHEVEKDLVKAEEYCGRAILANPGDGEILSLYGKLIWESQRDEGRAQGYFDQAVKAAPDDCYVLGSYASFLWDAEDEEEVEEKQMEAAKPAPLIQAF